MKLLIVDDSLVIRNKINKALLSVFHKIDRAENGEAALAMVKNDKPDVITMDLTMPLMDGVTCIEEILSLYPETYILVVSALADKQTAIAALTYGANGFLCKPFSPEDLCTAIEKILKIDLSK